MQRMTIREFGGKIVGYIDVDEKGNKVARKFNLQIVGRYDAKLNITRDFYNRIVGTGDMLSALLYKD